MFIHKNILTELLDIIHTHRLLPNDKISGICPVSFTIWKEVASHVTLNFPDKANPKTWTLPCQSMNEVEAVL
jgi:hypothetical protein